MNITFKIITMKITSQIKDCQKPLDEYQQLFYCKIRFSEFTYEAREISGQLLRDKAAFWSTKNNIAGINTYERKINLQDNATMQQTYQSALNSTLHVYLVNKRLCILNLKDT